MPPEQLPWDRRDFRKHDRSGPDQRLTGGGGFGGSGQYRWRDQHYHPYAPSHPPPYYHHHHNHPQQRWYSDFRSSRPIPPGHGKQGGWHMYPEEAGHGFPPFGSRYGDRNVEDDNFRPFGSRGEGKYFRNSRENRGFSSQKDFRSPSWEPCGASSSGPGRPNTDFNKLKAVENIPTCPNSSRKDNNNNNSENTQTCHNNNSKGNDSESTQTCHNNVVKCHDSPRPLPDFLSGQSEDVVREKSEKDGVTADEPANSGQKSDKENGLMNRNRSGSMSSRDSGSSRSSSSKSMDVDSVEEVIAVQQKNVTPINSPVAAVCVELSAPAPVPVLSDDTSFRKKPRLGWGEGLAKYEKKKVEGPYDGASRDVLVYSLSTTETIQLPSVSPLDTCHKVMNVMLDCASPTTPSSVACSFSPGIEEKESIKALNIGQDPLNLSCSPTITLTSQAQCDESIFNFENMDLTSIAKLSSSISEILQSDPSSAETVHVRTTSINKLMVWKVGILKALEMTESEIDSLETELKSLVAEARSSNPFELAYSNPFEQVNASSTVRPASLRVVPSGDMIVDHATLKDEDIDSPGSATSKLVAVLSRECVEGFASEGSENSSDLESSEYRRSDQDKYLHFSFYRHIYETILAANKDSLRSALDELNKCLPNQQCSFDVLAAANIFSVQTDSLVIKDRLLMTKRFLLFKEKVITLKFKVFQHFWRQGRVVSVNKLRGKSHKKLDLCRSGFKKNRSSSSRSRISYSAGSSRKVPAEEVIEFITRLLAESPIKPCRSSLKMPSLILDKGMKMSRFISNNALVEDPIAAEKERFLINPWTADETEIFIDMLAIFGKDFSKIASFLKHKTVADCIEFYYKNHKSECFRRAKPVVPKQAKSQPNTYLVANGKKWNHEENIAPLDVLGETSVIAANVNNDVIGTEKRCASRIFLGAQKATIGNYGQSKRSNSLDNNEAVAADVLAGICGSLSSEAMSSCITSSVDPTDGYQDWKCQRVSSCVKWRSTPDVTHDNVDDECSDESCGEMDPTDWTDEEKSFFVHAVSSYGKDFAMISECLRTRSVEQCKIFFSKARKCLGLDRVTPGAGNGTVCGDGGGSDNEGACVVQTGPVAFNDDSEFKMEVDVPSHHESYKAEANEMKPDFMICEENSPSCSLDPIAAEPVFKNSSMGDEKVMDSRERSDCANVVSTYELDVKKSIVSTSFENLHVQEGDDHGRTSGPSDSDEKTLAEISDVYNREDNEEQGLILPEDNLENEKVDEGGANSTEVGVMSCTSVESSTLFSVPIKYQRRTSTDALSGVSLNEKHSQEASRIFADSGEPSDFLRGYPEINVDFNRVKHVPLTNVPKRDGNLNSDRRHKEFSLRKCSTGSRDQTEIVSFTSKSGYSPDLEKPPPSRNGDVKLFGKILISSQEKVNSREFDDSNDGQHRNEVNLDSFQSKVDCINYLASDNNNNADNKSYCFQAPKISPLTDSAFLLAKYPAAFSNHSINTVKLDQTPSNSVPFNGISEYLRTCELQPFTVDMKQQPKDVLLLSEMQRRNGFNVVPATPRQPVVGGQCSCVSDPVTAIKLHYTKGQSGNMITREDDTWRISN